jgi:hypothetical protein
MLASLAKPEVTWPLFGRRSLKPSVLSSSFLEFAFSHSYQLLTTSNAFSCIAVFGTVRLGVLSDNAATMDSTTWRLAIFAIERHEIVVSMHEL